MAIDDLTMDRSGTSARLRHPDRCFIGGAWIKPTTTRLLTIVNPATEQPLARVAEALNADVDAAVAAAREAFDRGPWSRMGPGERAKYLMRLAGELRKRTPELVNAWVEQVGVILPIAEMLTPPSIAAYEYYASLADSFAWEEPRRTVHPGGYGLLVHEPVGVVAAIVPWNSPLMAITNKVAPALIAGCTIVLKPAVEAPLEAYILAECAEAAGLPPGVLNVIVADRSASDYLVHCHGVDKVSFTGSSAAGRRIAGVCADRVARVTLELGGKSAAIVLEDFDMGEAAAILGGNLCAVSGQVCASLTRILVPQQRHDEFVDAMAQNMRSVHVGNPFEAGVQMGPLAMARQLDRVQGYIAKGKADGAQLAYGGGRPPGLNRGYYVEPTLFANVDNSSTIAQEEIFGPVACVIPYQDTADAVRLANDSIFGLNGAVFTHSDDQAYRIARQISTGTVGQNGLKIDFSISFGGFKQSGIGREGGPTAILPYLESKTLILNGAPSHLRP
jgi:aldehyde dehydrogenase (NAD+)